MVKLGRTARGPSIGTTSNCFHGFAKLLQGFIHIFFCHLGAFYRPGKREKKTPTSGKKSPDVNLTNRYQKWMGLRKCTSFQSKLSWVFYVKFQRGKWVEPIENRREFPVKHVRSPRVLLSPRSCWFPIKIAWTMGTVWEAYEKRVSLLGFPGKSLKV